MVAHVEHPANDPDLVAHEQTYHMFNVLMRWCALHIAAIIVFLTLWFAAGAGFWGGLISGIAVFALGYMLIIRHEEHQPLDPWAGGQ